MTRNNFLCEKQFFFSMNFIKKFCGHHFISSEHILGHTKPTNRGWFGKPVLVWCKTNDQTVFNLTSTNGQFAEQF